MECQLSVRVNTSGRENVLLEEQIIIVRILPGILLKALVLDQDIIRPKDHSSATLLHFGSV